MDETLGKALKELRKDKGMSQMELAQAAGITRETVGRIEQGVSYPRTDTVRKLCAALGCDPNGLYGYREGGRTCPS